MQLCIASAMSKLVDAPEAGKQPFERLRENNTSQELETVPVATNRSETLKTHRESGKGLTRVCLINRGK